MLSAIDYIEKAARYLGLTALADDLRQDRIDENDERVRIFFDALNHVVYETGFYCPCVDTRTVTISGGVYPLAGLGSLVPIEVISITKNGQSIPFKIGLGTIELTDSAAAEGEFQLEIAVYSPVNRLEDEVVVNATVGEAVVVYGICSLYCIANGIADAAAWERKYRLAQNCLKKKAREKRVWRRVWA